MFSRLSLMFGLLFLVGQTAHAQNPSLRLWSEFVEYSKLISLLPELREHNLSLSVAVREDVSNLDDFHDLVIAARAQGVEIKPWLLLKEKSGYWFNKWNYLEAEAFVWKFVSEMEKRGLSLEWLIFDIEAPRELMEENQRQLESRKYWEMLRTLRKSAQSASLPKAVEAYRSLVEKLQSKNIRVEAVTTNFVLNDLNDNSRRIQNALGTPISGIPWDTVSVMVYRAEFRKVFGPTGTWIVAEHARRARRHFGERAAIDIGEVGQVLYPNPFAGFSDPADLHADIAAALSGGIDDIHIYSMDGILENGLDYWMKNPGTEKVSKANFRSKLMMFLVDWGRYLLPTAKH